MTTPPKKLEEPQQDADPRERRDKAAPRTDIRKPMFPNQADPPPQRPYPATSDEPTPATPPKR